MKLRRPRWRKMTWVLIVWSALMVLLVIAVVAGSDPAQECAGEALRSLCEAGKESSTENGVVLLIVFWFLGFVVLSLVWFMTRAKGRECPACGERVKRGETRCGGCGHNFALAAAGGPAALGGDASGG